MVSKSDFIKEHHDRLKDGEAYLIECSICSSIGVVTSIDKQLRSISITWHKEESPDAE